MTINDMENLWIAVNAKENFKLAIVALDEKEAMELAQDYFADSHMDTNSSDIVISNFCNDEDIDCDYIIF